MPEVWSITCCARILWTHARCSVRRDFFNFHMHRHLQTLTMYVQSLERVFRAQPRTHHRSEAELCQLAANSLLGASERLKEAQCISSPAPQLSNVHHVQVGKPPGPPKSKEERQDDFYANLGDAIRTLREDVPICLKSEIKCACRQVPDMPVYPETHCMVQCAPSLARPDLCSTNNCSTMCFYSFGPIQ